MGCLGIEPMAGKAWDRGGLGRNVCIYVRMHACVYATQPCYSLQLVAWSYSNLATTGFISAHGLPVPIYKGT